MLCVAAFSAQVLGDAAAGSKDVARAHPTPSRKQRNRTAHAITCNSTDRAQRMLQKGKSAQRANLRPRVSTKSEKRNRSHCFLPGSSKQHDENDADWSPNVVCKRRTVNVTATVATQTLVSPLKYHTQLCDDCRVKHAYPTCRYGRLRASCAKKMAVARSSSSCSSELCRLSINIC